MIRDGARCRPETMSNEGVAFLLLSHKVIVGTTSRVTPLSQDFREAVCQLI